MPKNFSVTPRPASAMDANSVQIPRSYIEKPAKHQQVSAPPEAGSLPDSHEPSSSAGEQLLSALWRSTDSSHQLGILDRQSNKFRNIPVTDAADAIEQAKNLSSDGAEVYFACAEFKNPDSRTAANAIGACGFWCDIDCGDDKAAAGKGYRTIKVAEDALRNFCQDTGLPPPTHVVHSGGGLHPYWVVDAAIPRDNWQSHARKLKALTKAHGFLADDSRTADIASVLRVPGTLNHKFSPPRLVTLEHAAAEYIERTVLLDAIAVAHASLCGTVTIKPSGRPSIVKSVTNISGSTDVYGPPDLVKLESALAFLDPDCDEPTWKLRRLAPLAEAARNYPEMDIELYELARSWSSGELRGKVSEKWITPGGNGLTGEQAFDEVWLRFLNGTYSGVPITLGTVYYDAKQIGWDPDDQFKIKTSADGEDA